MLNDRDMSITGSITLSPHESAALADACAAKAVAIAHECKSDADERRACYYDLLAAFFQSMAVATARGMHMRPDDEKKVHASLNNAEVCHD